MHDRVVAGRVVTPDGIVESGWVAITGEGIAAIGQGERPAARETTDYGAAYILPGGVDGQTHAGSQIGFPGLAPTTKAAVMGGITTIVDMPYDEPDPITTRALLEQKADAVHAHAVCDVALYGTVPATPDGADIAALVEGVVAKGVPREKIAMLGFSQGACLTAEFAVRHPARYGGIIAFTGGLIGPPGTVWNERGSFDGTPVFLGCSDVDAHVPQSRVDETAEVFARMGATVDKRIYPGMAHIVNDDEIEAARAILDRIGT